MNDNPNTNESVSQTRQLLAYMKGGNAITGLEALNRFGILSFTRRICDVEKLIGYPPLRRRIPVTNRRGKKVWVNQYWLEEEPAKA